MTLLVEDASPDSCFGLLLFLARLNGVDMATVPPGWIDYVVRWEAGEVVVPGDPAHAYGPLHNAVVHRHFDEVDTWTGAWVDGLRLLAHCVGTASPLAIAEAAPSTDLATARAYLNMSVRPIVTRCARRRSCSFCCR
jgi:hypothetical protein